MSDTQERTYTVVNGYLRKSDPTPAESRQFRNSAEAHAYANVVRGTFYDMVNVSTVKAVR